jgi:hypothetical protein
MQLRVEKLLRKNAQAEARPLQLLKAQSQTQRTEHPECRSIVYTTLGENALGVGMFHFFHFGD